MITLFILVETVARSHESEIITITGQHFILGKLFFVVMAAIAVIVPLWSNMFLLPIGTVAWGPNITSLLCILGWWIGSVIGFFLARTYRDLLVTKYPSLSKYEFIDSLFSHNHKMLSLILLRMTLPVDILSYALGLFSKQVTWKENAISTLIGITPFAFIFSYIGIFSPQLQSLILFLSLLLFIAYYIFIRSKKE